MVTPPTTPKAEFGRGVDYGGKELAKWSGGEYQAHFAIDPTAELSSDTEANPLFTGEYREGYELPEVTA